MPRFFLTTAIDYANGEPHLGHALEKVGADAIARAHRQLGYDVHFLIGMDEHGQKVAQTAEKQGVPPQQFVDDIAAIFQGMWARLGVSYDQFIRTTSPAHKAAVQRLIEQIFAADASLPESQRNFYERSYTGMYCVGCESFKQPADIVDGKCVVHPTRTLEEVTEHNWFFRLSAYTERLKQLFREQPSYLEPESRRNEILQLLEQGLEDISASRSRFDWGVPFPRPLSSGEVQTTYVWFDALPNYWTARFFPGFEQKAAWPANLHVIGKDITRFHTVIWPAMLMAAGEPLPGEVWAHGFISLGGERFSKSAGVKLTLDEAIERYGVDAFRYYLLRDVPYDGDGSFSWERFEEVYNSDLANTLGNLASRSIAMIEKYRTGIVPSVAVDAELFAAHGESFTQARAAVDGARRHRPHEAIASLMEVARRTNEFIQRVQPWVLAKDAANAAALDVVLTSLAASIAHCAAWLAPVMPHKMQALWTQLGGAGDVSAVRLDAPINVGGWKVTKGDPLFPKPEPPAKPAP
ncbi:MAG: methionine--tRNA ligase [Gemmatimonadaceae bacterium]|nr:methionine--tRNA ligase [Gemmatimonadaceae bacterium]